MSDHPRNLNGSWSPPRVAAAAVILIGGLVLAGWASDVVALKGLAPGLKAMNPGGTALAFLLAGASLWSQAAPGATPRRRALGIACAGGVLLIGAARGAGFLAGWGGGPDRLLFPAALAREAARVGLPNRMSPNTAAAFMLDGLALMTLDARTRRGVRPAQLLALAAGLIALLALIGYGYNAASLVGVRRINPMALNSAVAFAILTVGILLARPGRGVMAVVGTPGAGGVMARRLLPAAVLIPAVLGWVQWVAQQHDILDEVTGLSLFVLADIVLFVALIWWNAASLDRMDRGRRRAERRLEIQYTASLALGGSPRIDDAMPALLRAVCGGLGWMEAALWRVDPQADALRLAALWQDRSSRSEEFLALCRQTTFARGVGLPGRVWASGRSDWIPDVLKDSNFPRAAAAARAGLHGAFGFPVVVGRDILGVVEVFSAEIQQPDDELLRGLTAIGSQVGQLIMRKEAEEAVLRERNLLHTLMETVPDSIYFKDAESRFIRINRALADRFGLRDPAEAAGKTDFDFFTDEHARPAWEDEHAVIATGRAVVGKEEKETWGDGRITWVSTTRMPLRDEEGRIVGTFGISRDITEAKRAEEALRRGEERFRSLVEATAAIVWNTPESGEFEAEQKGWTEFTGQSFEQLRGWGWLDAVHPEDREATARAWSAALAARSLYQVEHRLRRSDGAYRHMLVRGVPVLDEGGRIREWVGVHTDIDAERRAEAAVREAEERSRLLLESSGEGIYGIDMQGLCTFINRAAAEMLGYAAEDVRGRNVHALIHHTRPDGSPYPVEECPIFRTRTGIACRVDDEVLWRRDGSAFPVEYASFPIRDTDGRIKGAVVNFTDITERKRVERELLRVHEAAQAATRAKSEFLANMSHEIRTPLNGIVGMTELTLDTELTPEQREYLGMVKLSADHLLSVINDILDFSKIEAGKLDLELIDFDVRDTLDDTVATLAMRAHKKGLELIDHVAADVPDSLVGDPHRLRQVLVNLLGNAIKFTERGEVVLRVEVVTRTEEATWLRFAVGDTGIGIAADQQKKLFRAFSQADTSTTRKYGGTGLGLAISARLVEMMGGTIEVDSEAGRGSTFHFTLRFGRARGLPARREPAEPAQVHGLPVLVVDDNATNRLILREMLAKWGMKPTVVEGAREALAALERAREDGSPFALVLLDAMMPEMDGFALAERIRGDSTLVGATLMMLSSANRREDVARCAGLDVASYLTKPIRQSILLDAIMTALGPSLSVDGRAAPASRPAPDEGERPLRLLLAEDNPVNQRLAVGVLEKRGHRVAVVGNGRDALAALDREPFDAVLMDVQMPEMDGFEATAAIRARESASGAHTPIVAMTAHAMKGDRERCLAAGMDAYVSKPLRPQELFEILGRLTCPDATPDADDPARAEAADRPPAFDLDAALDRVGGDAELMKELAGLFLDDCPQRMAEIRRAILGRDAPALATAAHALKGSVANFAAPAAVGAAARLETAGRSQDWDDVEPAWAALEEALAALTPALAGFGRPGED